VPVPMVRAAAAMPKGATAAAAFPWGPRLLLLPLIMLLVAAAGKAGQPAAQPLAAAGRLRQAFCHVQRHWSPL